jgi:hypothetical protein
MTSQTEDKPKHEQQRGSKDFGDGEVVKPTEALAYDDEELAVALANYVPDTAEERRLVRKIDFTLLPCLWWMYVLAYLDRGNIVSLSAIPFPYMRMILTKIRQMPMQPA